MTQTVDDIRAEIERVAKLAPGRPSAPIKPGEQFTAANNNPAGIRPHHAAGVLEKSDRLERYQFNDDGDVYITLAADEIKIDKPYTMLVSAVENSKVRPGTILDRAWRIYDADPEATPTDLFARFLMDYGVPVQVAGRSDLFIGAAFVPGSDTAKVIGYDVTPRQTVDMLAMVRGVPGGFGVTWAFGVDTGAYQDAVRRARG